MRSARSRANGSTLPHSGSNAGLTRPPNDNVGRHSPGVLRVRARRGYGRRRRRRALRGSRRDLALPTPTPPSFAAPGAIPLSVCACKRIEAGADRPDKARRARRVRPRSPRRRRRRRAARDPRADRARAWGGCRLRRRKRRHAASPNGAPRRAAACRARESRRAAASFQSVTTSACAIDAVGAAGDARE